MKEIDPLIVTLGCVVSFVIFPIVRQLPGRSVAVREICSNTEKEILVEEHQNDDHYVCDHCNPDHHYCAVGRRKVKAVNIIEICCPEPHASLSILVHHHFPRQASISLTELNPCMVVFIAFLPVGKYEF